MSEPTPWLYVTTAEVAAKLPHDAYLVDGTYDQWIERHPKFADGRMTIPALPFYACHPSFAHWNEQELYRIADADNESQYLAGIEKP